MTHKPPLPDGFDLPERVNGWVHDPESNKNGHTWYAPDETAAVGVFSMTGDVYAKVLDERVTGFGRGRYIFDDRDEDRIDAETLPESIATGVKKAVEWMERHDPPWKHPDVEPAAFDPPAGYVLDRYYLEEREHIVYYRREDAESEVKMAGNRMGDDDSSVETRAYLVVKTWRGSGNSTIALAPWLRAHDHEMHEVADPPEECGLDVALKLARDYVADVTGRTREEPAAGQADLGAWS